MPPKTSPSCGRSSCSLGPGLVLKLEIVLPAELQQREAVLRKWNRFPVQLRRHASIVKYGVPHQIWQEHLQERSSLGHRSLTIRKEVDRTGKRPLGKRQKHRAALLLCRRQSRGQLAESLRSGARTKVIGIVLRLIFLMQRRNRVRDKIY